MTRLTRLRVDGKLPFAQPGDIFFTRGVDGLGGLIRWAETEPGEGETWANHTGVVVRAGWMVPPRDGKEHALAHVSEALWKIEEHEWWGHHRHNQGYAVAVFRPKSLNNEDVGAIITDAHSRKGQSYAWWRLPVLLIRKLTFGLVPAEKVFFLEDNNICSTHMALAEEAGRVGFGRDPKEVTPDNGMDYCIKHPEKFDFVGWAVVRGVAPVMSGDAAGRLAAVGGVA